MLAVPSAVLLSLTTLPASWLIGPMVVSIVLSAAGIVAVRVPRPVFMGAQAVIGCIVASVIEPEILSSLASRWIEMAAVIAGSVCAAACAGWRSARFGTLPALTVAWGSTPGAASAMLVMSADEGADVRLVALMQYFRVIVVVLSASAVSRFLVSSGAHHAVAHGAVPQPTGAFVLVPFLETTVVAIVGLFLGRALRLPAGQLLGPMLLGGTLHALGIIHIDLPWWLFDATYAVVGTFVGVQFSLEAVRYAIRALPQIIISTVLLIIFCAGTAAIFAASGHVDPLTAYLATTPGGLDSVTIIALGSGANVPLVLALQTLRVFVVILTGPYIARFVARTA